MAAGLDEQNLSKDEGGKQAGKAPRHKQKRSGKGQSSEQSSGWARSFTHTAWKPSSLAEADRQQRLIASRESAQANPSSVKSELGPGAPLAEAPRRQLEADLGYDLAPVKIHTGPKAEAATRSLGAKAMTIGSSIAFSQGRFAPGTSGGSRLLRHELSHVIQQAGGSTSLGLSQPSGAGRAGLGPATQEHQADRLASRSRDSSWWQGAVGNSPAKQGRRPALNPLRGVRDLAVQLEPEDGTADVGKEDAQPESFSYTAKKGDTLSELAARFLGSADKMDEILGLNPDIKDPDHIEAGQVIKIPKGHGKKEGKEAKGDKRGKGQPKDAKADGDETGDEKGDAKKEDVKKADGAKGGEDPATQEAEGSEKAKGPQVLGPKAEPPLPDAPKTAPVNLPKVEGKANGQVKQWLAAHPDPTRGPRVEALGTVTNRVYGSSQTLAANMPSRATGWHGLDERVGNFFKDFKDVPFKGKNLGTLQKVLNVLHQVETGIGKASSVVGTIGTVATVGGAILTLLAPPVGAFLLAAGRLANVITLALASAKVIINIVKTALNAVQIAKEKDPEKLASLIGQMEKNIESGLMAGLDVVLSKTGGGVAGKAGGGFKKAMKLGGIKKAFKSGGIKGAMKTGGGQLKTGLKGGINKGMKGLKNNFNEFKKGLNPGTMLNRLKKGAGGGMRKTFVKPFADIRHATKDLGIAFKTMKKNASIKNFFRRDYWRNVYATNFPTLKGIAEARTKQKLRDSAVKDLRSKLKTEVDPRKQAEMFKQLKGLKNNKDIQTLSRQSKIGGLVSDLTDKDAGGFMSRASEALYGRTEYDARSQTEIDTRKRRGARNQARSAAKAEMRDEGLSWKGDLDELRKRTGNNLNKHYQDAHGKKVLIARTEAMKANPDVHSTAFGDKFTAEMERQYQADGKTSRIQRNIHFRGKAGEAHREYDGGPEFNRLKHKSGLDKLMAAERRDFKTATSGTSDLANAFKKAQDMTGLKGSGQKKKDNELKGMKKAASGGGAAAVAAEVKQWVGGVQAAAKNQTALSAEHQLDAFLQQAVHAMSTGAAPAVDTPAPDSGAPAPAGPQTQPLPAFGPGTYEQLDELNDQLATLAEVEAAAKTNLAQSQVDKADFLKDKNKVINAKKAAASAEVSAKKKQTEAQKAAKDVEKGTAANQKSKASMGKLKGEVGGKATQADSLAKRPVSIKAKNPPKPKPKEESGGFFSSVWGGIKKAATWVKDQAMKAVRAAMRTVTGAINKVKAYFTNLVTQMVMNIVKRVVGREQAARIDQAMLINKKKKLAESSAKLAETQTKAKAAKVKAAKAETALDRRIAQADKNIKDAQSLLQESQSQKAAVTAERDALKGGIDSFVAAHGAKIGAKEGAPGGAQPSAIPDGPSAPSKPQPVSTQTLTHLGQAADLIGQESDRSVGVVNKEADTATSNVVGSLGKLPSAEGGSLRKRASRAGAAAKAEHKATQGRRKAKVAAIKGRIAALAGQPANQAIIKITGELKAELGGVQADRNAALHGLYDAFTSISGDVQNLSTDVGDGLYGDDAKGKLKAGEAASH